MTHLNIPVGISDFAEIRQNGYYYVDKTGLIAEVLKAQAVKVTLITRPRRFGKTLGMSTLENFFSIRKDSAVLFQGLGIMNASALCQKWMNQCPTIFLSFKDVDGLTSIVPTECWKQRLLNYFENIQTFWTAKM